MNLFMFDTNYNSKLLKQREDTIPTVHNLQYANNHLNKYVHLYAIMV